MGGGEHANSIFNKRSETVEAGRRMAQLAALTLVEACTPWNGGWRRIADDLDVGVAQLATDADGQGLGLGAFLDPALVLGMPLSFF